MEKTLENIIQDSQQYLQTAEAFIKNIQVLNINDLFIPLPINDVKIKKEFELFVNNLPPIDEIEPIIDLKFKPDDCYCPPDTEPFNPQWNLQEQITAACTCTVPESNPPIQFIPTRPSEVPLSNVQPGVPLDFSSLPFPEYGTIVNEKEGEWKLNKNLKIGDKIISGEIIGYFNNVPVIFPWNEGIVYFIIPDSNQSLKKYQKLGFFKIDLKSELDKTLQATDNISKLSDEFIQSQNLFDTLQKQFIKSSFQYFFKKGLQNGFHDLQGKDFGELIIRNIADAPYVKLKEYMIKFCNFCMINNIKIQEFGSNTQSEFIIELENNINYEPGGEYYDITKNLINLKGDEQIKESKQTKDKIKNIIQSYAENIQNIAYDYSRGVWVDKFGAIEITNDELNILEKEYLKDLKNLQDLIEKENNFYKTIDNIGTLFPEKTLPTYYSGPYYATYIDTPPKPYEYYLISFTEKEKETVNIEPNTNAATPTLTDIHLGSFKYWLKFCSIATLVNSLPIYWPIGLLIPNPASGIIKIPFPIIWIPIKMIPFPTGIILIGIGLCGVCPGPFICVFNTHSILPLGPIPSNSAYFALGLRGTGLIKDNLNTKPLDGTLPIVNFGGFKININPTFSKFLPFVQDDLPHYSRLTPTNIPFVTLFLTKWCKIGKTILGFDTNP